MNDVASELHSLLSMYPENRPLDGVFLIEIRSFLNIQRSIFVGYLKELQEKNIPIPEKRAEQDASWLRKSIF